MLETLVMLLFSLLMCLVPLAIVVWLIVTGRLVTLDGLLFTVISLTVSGIFTAILAWSIHSGEFQDALKQLPKSQGQNDASSKPPAA